jgi:hypothetical protein
MVLTFLRALLVACNLIPVGESDTGEADVFDKSARSIWPAFPEPSPAGGDPACKPRAGSDLRAAPPRR